MFRIFRKSVVIAALITFGFSATPATATLLDQANWFEREVGSGLIWRYYHFDNLFGGKQSVSYIEVDLNNPSVEPRLNYRDSYVGPSPGVDHPSFPRARTSVLAPAIPGAKAAVNGTYFNTASYDSANPTTPWGGGTTYLKVGGTVIHTFDGSNVNRYLQGILFNDRTDVTIQRKSGGWSTQQSNWQNMMISGPILIDNGVIETYAADNSHANDRHPRTAIGKINASNTLILLTVDGRTPEALGMSCTELALVMQALGCDNAINLDGGGSTTLWAAGEPSNGVLNYPSDNGAYDRGGERGAANVFVIVSGDATPAAWDARMTNLSYNPLTRTGEDYVVTATYANIGSQTWTPSTVTLVPSRAFGRTSPFSPNVTMTPASVPPGQSATFTIEMVPPTVTNNTSYREDFALWHVTEGYFGPADNEARMDILVRPPIVGAPPMSTLHASTTNPLYGEAGGGWGNSTVSFPLLSRNSTERFTWSSEPNRYARFNPGTPVTGVYKVEIGFPFSSNSISAVTYTIKHANGTFTTTINQKSSALANTWITLGEFEFTESASKSVDEYIQVGNGSVTTGGDRFYSGAVRLDFVEFTTVADWSLMN